MLQFDEFGVFHQLHELEGKSVELFSLVNTWERDRRIDILIPDGAVIVHKYRNFIFNANTPEERRERVYIIGFRKGEEGHYNFVLPNEQIIQADHEEILLSSFIQ